MSDARELVQGGSVRPGVDSARGVGWSGAERNGTSKSGRSRREDWESLDRSDLD